MWTVYVLFNLIVQAPSHTSLQCLHRLLILQGKCISRTQQPFHKFAMCVLQYTSLLTTVRVSALWYFNHKEPKIPPMDKCICSICIDVFAWHFHHWTGYFQFAFCAQFTSAMSPIATSWADRTISFSDEQELVNQKTLWSTPWFTGINFQQTKIVLVWNYSSPVPKGGNNNFLFKPPIRLMRWFDKSRVGTQDLLLISQLFLIYTKEPLVVVKSFK